MAPPALSGASVTFQFSPDRGGTGRWKRAWLGPEAWDGQPRDFSFTRVDRSTIWCLIEFRFDDDPYAKIERVETGP